jgi:major membrane immunogen (membrane-anchored lipoprotein)
MGRFLMKKLYMVFMVVVILLATSAYNFSYSNLESELRDGYYTAEVMDYHHGWKEFLTIYVNNGRIVTTEYNARNRSGFIKSWDVEYMRVMNKADHNYPNKYTRKYTSELLERQGTQGIDAMSGATESYLSFRILADAAIAQAKAGSRKVAFVKVERPEH